MLRSRLILASVVFAAAAIAAGCGGGGGGVVPNSTPTPSPYVGPTVVPIPSSSPEIVSLTTGPGGDTLTFDVPPPVFGSPGTISAVLQTALPGGVNNPQAHSSAGRTTPVKPLASIYQGLAYLVISTTEDVGFSNTPTFQYTVPTGSIPAGDNAYVLFWDPQVGPINGWTPLLQGTVSGNTVSFPATSSGVKFAANTQYIFALAHTAQKPATATPAPPPTPSPVPSILPTPAYCSAYASPSPNPGGAHIYITDDSQLNVPLIVYVVLKPKISTDPILWLDANQNFTSSVPVPLPAACFSTTLNSASKVPLITPDGMPGGRWYFAYATPVPGHPEQVPNPMASMRDSGPGFSYSEAPYPYDFVEGGTTNDPALIIDTTQVDALGLPMDLSTQPASAPLPVRGPCAGTTLVVGVSSCNYANIFRDMSADPVYGKLVIAQPFNGQNYDLRILSPQQGPGRSGFEWNVLADASALPNPLPASCTGSTPYGYLSCIMSSYATTPRMYSTNLVAVAGAVGSGDLYCVSSDNNSNFIMTDVGPGPGPQAPVPASASRCGPGYTPAPNPSGAPVNPFKMPVQEFLYGVPPPNDGGGGCKVALLLSQPWGLANIDATPPPPPATPAPKATGHIFHTNDAFALWKAMNAEFVYGTALSTQEHPVGYFYSSSGNKFMPPSFAPLFADPMYDTYAIILHRHFDNSRSYALPFDDFFDLATTLHYSYSHAISVRINPIPVAAAPSSPNPAASPDPNPCPPLPANIGGF